MRPTRHQAREVALQMLYRYDMATQAHGTPAPVGVQLLQELTQHFEHFQVPAEIREFAAQLVAGSLNDQASLDERLEKHASNWKVSRMASVDRSLLRMATYEMLNFADTPASVIIDEAVELGKQFGTTDTSSFVNGILDAIRKDLGRT